MDVFYWSVGAVAIYKQMYRAAEREKAADAGWLSVGVSPAEKRLWERSRPFERIEKFIYAGVGSACIRNYKQRLLKGRKRGFICRTDIMI